MAITRSQQAKQLLALGGRIGLQEGGGIMPRLNQLGSGVSSAEQTLQEINQRLESAESSLGEGGVEQLQAVQPGSNNLFLGRPIFELQGQPMKIDPPSFARPGNIPGTNVPYSTLRGGDQVERLLPSNQFSQVTPPQTPVEMQTPLSGIPAAGYADGGMLVKPGFGGKRQGYRGDDAYGGGRDPSSPAGSTGTGGFGPTGPQELGISTRGPAGPVDKSTNEQNRLERIRAIEKLIDRPRFGLTGEGKFNVTDLFSGPRATFKNPKRGDEGGRDMPLWMQLGYSSEEEYNRAMSGDTGAPVTSTPPVDLNRMAYRLMADGGAVMDDEPRQAYGLGSIVKKATRAIKKVAKSDIGKIALLYAATGGLGNLAQGQGFFTNFTSPTTFLGGAKNIFTKAGAKNILFGGEKLLGNPAKGNLVPFSGLIGKGGQLTGAGALRGLAAVSALPLLGIGVEDEEEEKEPTSPYLGEGLDIAAIRADPRRFQGQAYRLMAEGGDTEDAKEPVAKKVMPLIDMDGKEKDYRETGGFVDMGRMEKADDVPARLSKNEFVFTADAVRNAGDGSVDKGAEVMYNMMKNLEAGGEVSEESQGLEGARKMFQTSQRLEEVL